MQTKSMQLNLRLGMTRLQKGHDVHDGFQTFPLDQRAQ